MTQSKSNAVTSPSTDRQTVSGASAPVVLHTRVVTGSGGGPDKTILNSPRFLSELGYNSVCAYLRPRGDAGFEALEAMAEKCGASLSAVDDRGPFDLKAIRKMLKICRAERVAIWHGHDYKSNAIGLLLRRFWPMRLVSTVHGWGKTGGRTPLYYKIDRFCLRHYDRVICVSQDLHEQCLAAQVPPSRCVTIANAIDTRQYARTQSPAEAKRRLGMSSDRLLVGAVGRLSDEKAFDQLIRVADGLIRDGCNMDLVIVGEGSERPALTALIEELGQQDRIRLLGYRADTIDLYQAMDAFVLSSLREGLPNVVLEAMALETPVVATAVAGVPTLIRSEHDGLIVPVGGWDELAASLGRLLVEPELRRRLAAAGRETIEQRFSFSSRMKKVAKLYDGLLS